MSQMVGDQIDGLLTQSKAETPGKSAIAPGAEQNDFAAPVIDLGAQIDGLLNEMRGVDDRSFDIVAQLTMFTSILDRAMRREAAAEMQRVLAPAGAILWYDFRYPSPFNRDVRPVRLREIRALFPGWRIDGVTTTLLPPLARRLARISFQACAFLESALPLLRSHHLALLT